MPPALRGPISRSLGQRRSTVEAGGGANRLGGGQSRGQRKQRQASGGNLRAQQHAHIKPFARGRVPRVIAAPAAGQLLIGKIDRAVRRSAARGIMRIGVGGISDRRKMQLARKDGSGKRGLQRGQVVRSSAARARYSVSAAMRMEMSAALAEWVSAPTLIKSTPVSA